jgi:hypothetical protein
VEDAIELDGGGLWLELACGRDDVGGGVVGGRVADGVVELPWPLVVHAARSNNNGQRRRINPSSRRSG